MIPKVIHYCWFGGNPLSELAKRCIDSWKKFCPDYEIKEWNESNFDLECCAYVKEAYQAKKWAFVSDYARFWILYHEGGLYFDTDVEVIKPFDDIVERGAFMGCEAGDKCAPGLGLGVNPGLGLYKEILDFYENLHFLKENGDIDTTTIVEYTSNILERHGWKPNNKIQTVTGITIYPPEYFCPMDYDTGKITISPETHSVHHYTASWHGKNDKKILKIKRFCINHFGKSAGSKVARILDFPYRVMNKVERLGFSGMLKFAVGKVLKIK